jgi:hypothetical protein
MGSPDLAVWIIVLIIQTVPYIAAIIVSLISALPLPASVIGTPSGAQQQPAPADGSRAEDLDLLHGKEAR